MTPEEFVERIRVAVYDAAVRSTLSNLEQPAGRKPALEAVELSLWYSQQSGEDHQQIRRVIEEAAAEAVFGILAVLDGARSIRSEGESSGSLVLRHESGEGTAVLNGQQAIPLHDLFSA